MSPLIICDSLGYIIPSARPVVAIVRNVNGSSSLIAGKLSMWRDNYDTTKRFIYVVMDSGYWADTNLRMGRVAGKLEILHFL